MTSRAERRVVALLAPATFFEGYDGMVLGLALPLIGKEFGLGTGALGVVASIVFGGSFGVLVLLPLADRFGRRPLLAVTIVGYTAATFATAFSRGVVDFVAYQFVARVFLGAEYALATIVLVESLPRRRVGRALGLVSSMSAFGQAGAGLGFLVVVAAGASWRLLYLVGILPLILVARARRDLPETAPASRTRRGMAGTLAGVRRSWLVGSSAVSFLFALFPTAVTTFASFLVLNEWKWKLSTINPAYLVLWLLAVSGFFVAGRLLDRWGRRPTAAVFFAGAGLVGLFAFRFSTTPGRVLGLALVIFFLTGATPCMAAYTTEPFPKASRGRVGAILRTANIAGAGAAPALTGLLASGRALGSVAGALSVVGLSYAAAAVVVLALLPETRGDPMAAPQGLTGRLRLHGQTEGSPPGPFRRWPASQAPVSCTCTRTPLDRSWPHTPCCHRW
jgi:putative MFS transporter